MNRRSRQAVLGQNPLLGRRSVYEGQGWTGAALKETCVKAVGRGIRRQVSAPFS